ncbi:MAG: hypothetical protein UCH28_03560 [Adlercreutzia sp.]|nr:hypothetical protein [Adlercreutzia sp.]
MESNATKRNIVIAVVAALLLSIVIPMDHWDKKIPSQRYVSEGVVVSRESSSTIAVRLNSATQDGQWFETGTYLLLEGNIPNYVNAGQRVQVGYSAKGLYEDTSQKVVVSFYKHGNILTGAILPAISPFGSSTKDDLQIVDIQSDGSPLAYSKAM